MNFILKDYQIPSTVTFFDSKVQRNIGYIYGFNINDNGSANIIKIAAGTFENTFNKFFNFKDINGSQVNAFWNNYPEKNSYNSQCKLYYVGKNIGTKEEIRYNAKSNKWTTDKNYCSYYFASGNINLPSNSEIGFDTIPIKNLINDNIHFPQTDCISTFIYDDCNDYLYTKNVSGTLISGNIPASTLIKAVDVKLSNIEYSLPNIEYTSGLINGITFYDAKKENKIGYIYGLQIKDNQADVIKVPSIKCNEITNYQQELFTYNNEKNYFNKFYPESKSYITKCNIYYITKNNMYYNTFDKSWSTDKSKATYFFTAENATNNIGEIEDATVNFITVPIKYLTNDANLTFPIKANQGFILVDVQDYI